MKKLITILLCLTMLIAMVACSSDNNKADKPGSASGGNQPSTQQGSGTDKPDSSNDPNNSDNQGNDTSVTDVEFKYEDIDMESVLKPMTHKEVKTPYNSTVKLLVTPFEIDDDTLIANLKQAELTKDLTFYKNDSESGDSIHVINTEDIWTKYKTHHRLQGCPSGSDSVYDYTTSIYLRYEPSEAIGPTVIDCEFEEIDKSDVQKFQRQAEEVLTNVFGKDFAHAIVYDKADDADEKEGYREYSYSKEFEFEDGEERTKYRVVRESLESDYSGFTVRYAVYMSSSVYNRFDHFHEEYTPLISEMPLDLNEIINSNAGKIDVNDYKDSLVPYLSVAGKEQYEYTFLDEYEYECKEHPSGITEMSLEVGFQKNSQLINARMNIEIEAEIDRNNNNELKSMSLNLSGFPDQISSSDWQTYYPEMLVGVKEQLNLLFGDGIDVSDLTMDKFETTYTDDKGTEEKECELPVKTTILGKEVEGKVRIEMFDTVVDTLRAKWSFSVEIDP